MGPAVHCQSLYVGTGLLTASDVHGRMMHAMHATATIRMAWLPHGKALTSCSGVRSTGFPSYSILIPCGSYSGGNSTPQCFSVVHMTWVPPLAEDALPPGCSEEARVVRCCEEEPFWRWRLGAARFAVWRCESGTSSLSASDDDGVSEPSPSSSSSASLAARLGVGFGRGAVAGLAVAGLAAAGFLAAEGCGAGTGLARRNASGTSSSLSDIPKLRWRGETTRQPKTCLLLAVNTPAAAGKSDLIKLMLFNASDGRSDPQGSARVRHRHGGQRYNIDKWHSRFESVISPRRQTCF